MTGIEAIDKLINHYSKYAPTGIPDSYGAMHIDQCPICIVYGTGATCDLCPWILFEGKHCMDFATENQDIMGPRLYETGTAAERIDRLNRWKNELG